MSKTRQDEDDLQHLLAGLPEPAPAQDSLRRRVLAVPERYQQRASSLDRLRARLPELGRWLSAPALAAQAMTLFVVLAAGVWAGWSTGAPQVDMSSWAPALAGSEYPEELL